jgi:hypothetical protein
VGFKKLNVLLRVYIVYITAFFVLVFQRFDLIQKFFCDQAMESPVVRYNHVTLHREDGKSSGS